MESVQLNDQQYKHDGNKDIRYELIPVDALKGLAKVFAFGANKYEPNSWKKLDKSTAIERTYGSILRHLYSTKEEDFYDKESGLPHIDHAITQMMILRYYLKLNNKLKER